MVRTEEEFYGEWIDLVIRYFAQNLDSLTLCKSG